MTFITSSDTDLQRKFRLSSAYIMALALAVAITGLLGWEFDINVFRHPLPHMIAINPLSAICFLCAALSFLNLRTLRVSSVKKMVGITLASVPLLIGVVRFFEIMANKDFRIDQLLYYDKFQQEAVASLASHLALNTAFTLILLGVMLLFINNRNSRVRKVSDVAATIVFLLGLLAIIGAIYRVEQYTAVLSYLPVSVPTAVAMTFAAVAIILDNSHEGIYQFLFRVSLGGTIARILVPAAIVIPIVLGYLRLSVHRQFPITIELGTSYLVTGIILVFLALVAFTSLTIERKDAERKHAQNELKEMNAALERTVARRTAEVVSTERLFKTLIENSVDAIVLTDNDINVTFQSPGAERMTGISLEHRRNNPGVSYTHPDEVHVINERTDEARNKPGIPIPFQSRFLHKNGYYIWIEGFITNFLDDPDIHALAFNYRDVTERKKMEERQNLYVSMIDLSSDAIISMSLDNEIITWNHGAEDLFGFTSAETVGQSGKMILPGHLRDEEMEIFDTIRRGELIENFDTERITKGGTVVFISLTVSPIRNNLKEIIGVSMIARDISERREIQKKIAASELRFRALIEGSTDGIAMLNADNSVNYRSPAAYRILGKIPGDEMAGRLLTSHPDDEPAIQEQYGKMMANPGMPVSFQGRFSDSKNSYFWLEVIMTNMLDVLGVNSIVINFHDITERRTAEDQVRHLNAELEEKVIQRTSQLQSVNKELEAFTYSVSHDLRAPLRIINGFSQILIEDYDHKLDEAGQKTLNGIIRNARKMSTLIDDLLEFSRVGRKEIRISSIDMTSMVNDLLTDIRSTETLALPEVTVHPLLETRGDGNLIKQVWVNLISNAIKYSSRKNDPAVEIGMLNDDGTDYYYIRDNGAGFDMAYANKLFGVFQRLHRQDEFEGTGVGLALVKRIIERHGGVIKADSKINEFALFYFSLPTA